MLFGMLNREGTRTRSGAKDLMVPCESSRPRDFAVNIFSFFLIFLLISLNSCQQLKSNLQLSANEDGPGIKTLRSDLNFPWEILWGKDDYIWMTERGGKISKI